MNAAVFPFSVNWLASYYVAACCWFIWERNTC